MAFKEIFESNSNKYWRLRVGIKALFQVMPLLITVYFFGYPQSGSLLEASSVLVLSTILCHAAFTASVSYLLGKKAWASITLKDYLISLLFFSVLSIFALIIGYMEVSGWNYLGVLLMGIFN